MNHTYQTNKHNRNSQNNDINVGFTTNTKFVLSQLRQRKFWSIHIQISTNFKKFVFNQSRTFNPSPICTLQRFRKTCKWLDEQFRTFYPPLHESVASLTTKNYLRILTNYEISSKRKTSCYSNWKTNTISKQWKLERDLVPCRFTAIFLTF